jgi:hypothetical protein
MQSRQATSVSIRVRVCAVVVRPSFFPDEWIMYCTGTFVACPREGRKGKEVGAWREGERRGRVVGGKRNLTNKGT